MYTGWDANTMSPMAVDIFRLAHYFQVDPSILEMILLQKITIKTIIFSFYICEIIKKISDQILNHSRKLLDIIESSMASQVTLDTFCTMFQAALEFCQFTPVDR
jgi:hypothetical protein